MELVSVIIPTYNSEACIAQALDSVFAQTHSHIEIVVVDDGSSDATVEVARSKLLEESPYEWRLIERETNGGPSSARNVGFRASRGTWIQFLDSDDLLAPTKLERQMAAATAAPPTVAAVHSPWRIGFVKDCGREWDGQVAGPDMEGKHPIMCLSMRTRPLVAAALIRRTLLEQVGGFDESLRFWECEELMFRLAGAGALVLMSSEPTYLWRWPRDIEYIGGIESKYKSASVALAWVERILEATAHQPIAVLQLPERDLDVLLDEATQWARRLYVDDREAFARYMMGVRKLEPTFRPSRPWHLALVTRFMTYERAEAMSETVRRLRDSVRRVLRAVLLTPGVVGQLD